VESPVAVAPETSAPDAAPARRPLRDRLAPLFPPAPSGPLTVKKVVFAAAAVVLGAGISLGRVGGPGPFNTIFAEDGNNLLTDALNLDPYHAIRRPVNGYFLVGSRVLTEVAALFPVAWAPAVMNIEAALVTAVMALAVFVASAGAFRSTAARLLVSVPVIVMPLAENQAATTSNSLATLQFLGVYTLFWLLLWTPASRAGRVTAVLAVAAIATSTLLAAVFLPLALIRLYVRRTPVDALLAAVLALGAAMHLTALALGRTARPAFLVPRMDPRWALDTYTRWAVPHAIFGYRWLGDPWPLILHPWRVLTVLAWLVVLAALVAAWRRITRPAWGLALIAAASSIAMFSFQVMSSGLPEERYAIAPGMLMIVTMAALLQPAERRYGSVPFIAFAVLLTAVIVVNYRAERSFRTLGPAWDDQLRAAVATCNAEPTRRVVRVPTAAPEWQGHWYVDVPCHKIRE
jgi:hypothetical protein